MPTKPESRPPELQKTIEHFGLAVLRWRELNGWSQQVPHDLARILQIKFFNSQIAYLERGILDPKPAFFIAFAKFNQVISKAIFPPVQEGFTESTLERLQDSEPFLNAEGEVATASDLFSMFVGEQPLNKKYTQALELTEEFCNAYGHKLEDTFNNIGHELLLSPKDTWVALAKTKGFPKDKGYQSLCRDILRGAHELTKEETIECLKMTNYKACPCYRGLSLLAKDEKDPVDISELTKANTKLLTMVG